MAKSAEWKQFVEAMFVHKYLIIATILFWAFAFWVTLMVWPRKYESETRLKLRVGRESVGLDPTATTSQTLMLQKTQEEEVNSALEILRSRRIAERVVDKLGAENVREGVLPKADGGKESAKRALDFVLPAIGKAKDAANSVLLAAGIKDPLSDRELAVMELEKSWEIAAERLTTIISIRAVSQTPEMAQAIARTIAEEFISENSEVMHNVGSFAFFDEQVDEATDELVALETTRMTFMQGKDLIDVAAAREILVGQLETIEGELISSRAVLNQVEAEIEDVEQNLVTMPDEIVAAKQESSDATWSGMRQTVYTLEMEEKELAAKYSADSPRLIHLREQLLGAREILEKFQSERVDESLTPNPMKLSLQEDLQKLRTQAVGLESVLKKRQSQHDEALEKVRDLLQTEIKIGELDRDVKVADSRLALLSEKREEARVMDQLQSQGISNIAVFQPATFVERAASPNKKLLAVAFMFLGVSCGVSLAFLREVNSSKVRSPSDVESLPAVAAVARLGRYSHLISRKKVIKAITSQRDALAELHPIFIDASRGSDDFGAREQGVAVGVIGLNADAGSTSLAAVLAAIAVEDFNVEPTLVDADFEGGGLSRLHKASKNPGLVEFANGEASYGECITMQPNEVKLISRYKDAGTASAKSVHAAVRHICDVCELVIVDLPPVEEGEFAVSLAQRLDHVVVVVDSEKTGRAALEQLTRRIGLLKQTPISVVVNKAKSYVPRIVSENLGLPG